MWWERSTSKRIGGNTVIIKHDEHLYTSLNHLKEGSIKVKAGDTIKEGDEIGRCGNSGRSPYPHLHFQIQETPYIGSVTREYPISYHILHQENSFDLKSFEVPALGDQISNIERNELLYNAFHFIPGKRFHFDVIMNGEQSECTWEVNTDPYNNAYIRCQQSGAIAYFVNDGNLLFFTHYSGHKKDLLYYFFMSTFQVQQGFYQDLTITDSYPLNLIFRQPLLGIQIRIASSAKNSMAGKTVKTFEFTMVVNEKGIHKLTVDSKNLKLRATCTE